MFHWGRGRVPHGGPGWTYILLRLLDGRSLRWMEKTVEGPPVLSSFPRGPPTGVTGDRGLGGEGYRSRPGSGADTPGRSPGCLFLPLGRNSIPRHPFPGPTTARVCVGCLTMCTRVYVCACTASRTASDDCGTPPSPVGPLSPRFFHSSPFGCRFLPRIVRSGFSGF